MPTSTNFFRLVQTSICLVLIAVVCVGCGKPKADPANQAPASDTGQMKFRSAEEAQQALAGLWVGQAVINQEALNGLLAEMTEPERQALLKESETFMSTQMVIQMTTDGNMKTAVEVTPAGAQTMRGQTLAQWNVTEVQGNEVMVQSSQQNEQGDTKTTNAVYAVSPDGNRIVLRANIASAFKQCEPLIYLDRQVEERFAQTPSTIR